MTNPAILPSRSHQPPWIILLISMAALYFGKEVFLPLSLAVLLSFLLTPSVRRLERWRIPRVPAVLFVLAITFTFFAAVGVVVVDQLLEIINQLPSYKTNIEHKLEAVRGNHASPLAKATDSFRELTKELSGGTAKPPQPAEMPRNPSRTQRAAALAETVRTPQPVELVEPPQTALQSLRNVLGPMLAPLGGAVIVGVFTTVMLLKREDLRNRLLRLIGQSQVNLATQAFDDATNRVSRYLRMQFIINSSFGLLIATGLHLIDLPSAILWGVLAGLLRFFPYVGPLIGGGIPLAVSLAVFPGWRQPVYALGLFLIAEIVVAYVVEPWLYGKHTGISSLAILVAAAFWAILWGPIGLVLSTPLTVCLMVVGRYVPQFEFLFVLLGDEPVLPPETQFYQRLLAMDQLEARKVLEDFLKDRSLTELYDTVLVPALSLAESDRHKGALDEIRENFLIQSVSEFVAELGEADTSTSESSGTKMISTRRVICLPAKDNADEISAAMLAQLLERSGVPSICLPAGELSAELLDDVCSTSNDIVFISALPPFALLHARTLTKELQSRMPQVQMMVGIWNSTGDTRAEQRIDKAFPVDVVSTLAQAVERVGQMLRKRPAA